MTEPLRHCRPTCNSCEATERLLQAARVAEDAGRVDVADAAMLLAEVAGTKSVLGQKLTGAVLTDTRHRAADPPGVRLNRLDPRACPTCGLWQRTARAAALCPDPVHDNERPACAR